MGTGTRTGTAARTSAVAEGAEIVPSGGAHVVRSWGDNRFGELGDRTTIERHTPVYALNSAGGHQEQFNGIDAGTDASAGMVFDGVYAWGTAGYGGRRNRPPGYFASLAQVFPAVQAFGISIGEDTNIMVGLRAVEVPDLTGCARAAGSGPNRT